MAEEIRNILLKIINSGFDAYIVGGYVRDFIMGKETTDIDICTTALPKDLANIFAPYNIKISNYGSIKIITNKYSFDIATMRKELNYKNNKPDEIEYIDDINIDILRRDFTINSLYMDVNGNIIDILNAVNDINQSNIKIIGDLEEKLKEDYTRMLRALRFKISLNFKLDNNITNYIKKHKKDIENIPIEKQKEEMDKILISEHCVSGLDYLSKLGILDVLNIKYRYQDIVYVDDINGMYAQLEVADNYPFTKEEKDHINAIRDIINYRSVDYGILFKYDLYLCLVAGKILGYTKKDINNIYKSMKIKNIKELAINGDEIQMLLNIKPSKVIKDIINSLVVLVLNNKIANDKEVLKKYIIDNKRMWL